MNGILSKYLALVFAGILLSTTVSADVVYDNFDAGMTFDYDTGHGVGGQSEHQTGMVFTPSRNGYLKTLYVAASNFDGAGNITFTLYNQVGGEPGAVLEVFHLSGLPDFETTFSAQRIIASGGTYLYSSESYWLVASQPNIPDTSVWNYANTGDAIVAWRDTQFDFWTVAPHERQFALRVDADNVPLPSDIPPDSLPLDSNGDGISDADAIALGLDPNDPDGDTDNDGLTDVDEVGDITAPMDNDGDGVIDAQEPGPDASSAEIASGLLLVSGDTVTIRTEPGEMLSRVSATEATDSPGGIKFPYGMVSYVTTSQIGGSVTVRMTFPVNLPDNLVIEKVDRANNYTPLPNTVWSQVGNRSVDITLTDGDPLTDLDGAADGSIEDPVAVGVSTDSGGSGGCTIGSTSSVDPVWLLILFVSGVGYLRRHSVRLIKVAAKKAA